MLSSTGCNAAVGEVVSAADGTLLLACGEGLDQKFCFFVFGLYFPTVFCFVKLVVVVAHYTAEKDGQPLIFYGCMSHTAKNVAFRSCFFTDVIVYW